MFVVQRLSFNVKLYFFMIFECFPSFSTTQNACASMRSLVEIHNSLSVSQVLHTFFFYYPENSKGVVPQVLKTGCQPVFLTVEQNSLNPFLQPPLPPPLPYPYFFCWLVFLKVAFYRAQKHLVWYEWHWHTSLSLWWWVISILSTSYIDRVPYFYH